MHKPNIFINSTSNLFYKWIHVEVPLTKILTIPLSLNYCRQTCVMYSYLILFVCILIVQGNLFVEIIHQRIWNYNSDQWDKNLFFLLRQTNVSRSGTFNGGKFTQVCLFTEGLISLSCRLFWGHLFYNGVKTFIWCVFLFFLSPERFWIWRYSFSQKFLFQPKCKLLKLKLPLFCWRRKKQ